MHFRPKSFYHILALLIVICSIDCMPQETNDTLKALNKHFQSFEYEETISTADSLLLFRSSFSNDLLLEIFRIKAISHFSLLQDKQAGESFFEILTIDSSYTLDSAITSPKIIAFFGEIKNHFREDIALKQKNASLNDTVFVTRLVEDPEVTRNVKNSVLRSIVLPGWGHLYLGESFKGIVLTSLSLVTMASSLYFIIDTKKKEDDYEKAFNLNDIASRYDSFNSSYKIRNFSMIAFVAVWIYSQIDLLLLSPDSHEIPVIDIQDNPVKTGLEVIPGSINFQLQFNF